VERGPGQDRVSVLDPAAQRLQQEWSRASARLFAVYTERLAGKATQKELADAVSQVCEARAAWSREIGLLATLSANKLDDVQGRLARDANLGADLRELVAEHPQKARARWETRKAWSVTLPLPI